MINDRIDWLTASLGSIVSQSFELIKEGMLSTVIRGKGMLVFIYWRTLKANPIERMDMRMIF